MKYDLNLGVSIVTAYGDPIVLYSTYFIWKKTGDYYTYSKCPENLLILIWEARWPYRNCRDRILSHIVGFDFIKAFKRTYSRHNC